MNIEPGALLAICSAVTIGMLFVAIVLAVIRLLKGPDVANRVVALDLVSVLVVALISAFAVYAGEYAFLDVAIAYGLIAFLGTVALARYLARSRPVNPKAKDD
jgi:multicomponent Na+:H+ antiporter subunit F